MQKAFLLKFLRSQKKLEVEGKVEGVHKDAILVVENKEVVLIDVYMHEKRKICQGEIAKSINKGIQVYKNETVTEYEEKDGVLSQNKKIQIKKGETVYGAVAIKKAENKIKIRKIGKNAQESEKEIEIPGDRFVASEKAFAVISSTEVAVYRSEEVEKVWAMNVSSKAQVFMWEETVLVIDEDKVYVKGSAEGSVDLFIDIEEKEIDKKEENSIESRYCVGYTKNIGAFEELFIIGHTRSVDIVYIVCRNKKVEEYSGAEEAKDSIQMQMNESLEDILVVESSILGDVNSKDEKVVQGPTVILKTNKGGIMYSSYIESEDVSAYENTRRKEPQPLSKVQEEEASPAESVSDSEKIAKMIEKELTYSKMTANKDKNEVSNKVGNTSKVETKEDNIKVAEKEKNEKNEESKEKITDTDILPQETTTDNQDTLATSITPANTTQIDLPPIPLVLKEETVTPTIDAVEVAKEKIKTLDAPFQSILGKLAEEVKQINNLVKECRNIFNSLHTIPVSEKFNPSRMLENVEDFLVLLKDEQDTLKEMIEERAQNTKYKTYLTVQMIKERLNEISAQINVPVPDLTEEIGYLNKKIVKTFSLTNCFMSSKQEAVIPKDLVIYTRPLSIESPVSAKIFTPTFPIEREETLLLLKQSLKKIKASANRDSISDSILDHIFSDEASKKLLSRTPAEVPKTPTSSSKGFSAHKPETSFTFKQAQPNAQPTQPNVQPTQPIQSTNTPPKSLFNPPPFATSFNPPAFAASANNQPPSANNQPPSTNNQPPSANSSIFSSSNLFSKPANPSVSPAQSNTPFFTTSVNSPNPSNLNTANTTNNNSFNPPNSTNSGSNLFSFQPKNTFSILGTNNSSLLSRGSSSLSFDKEKSNSPSNSIFPARPNDEKNQESR